MKQILIILLFLSVFTGCKPNPAEEKQPEQLYDDPTVIYHSYTNKNYYLSSVTLKIIVLPTTNDTILIATSSDGVSALKLNN